MTVPITLSPLANLQNENTAVNTINTNSTAITTAFGSALDTAGDAMEGNLDMNANRLINLPAPISNTEPMRVIDAATLNGGGTITVSPLPSGGNTNQVLAKNSGTNFDVSWQTIGEVPTGGSTNQVLKKNSGTNFDTGWTNAVTSVALTAPADFNISGSPVTTTGTLGLTWASTPTGSGPVVRENNPTITGPTIATINNGGTLTLPTGPDTILSATNVATLTNKTMSTSQLSGTLLAAQMPALTGSVTTAGGSLSTSIAPGVVTNNNFVNMPALTIKANNVSASGQPVDMDITALPTKTTPVAGDILFLQDSASSNAFKQTTVGAVASAASAVGSVGGLTGAIGLGSGLSVAVSGNNISEDVSMIGEIRWFPFTNAPNTNYKLCDGTAISRATFARLFSNLNKSATVTFTNASTHVGWTAHGLSVTDVVKLYTTGTLPTNFTAATAGTGGTVYYVQSVIDANTITLASTPGGSAITAGSSGTGTQTGINSFWGDGDGSTTFNLPDLRGEFLRAWDANKGTDANRAVGVYQHQADAFASHTHTIGTANTFNNSQGVSAGASASPLPVAAGSTGSTGGTETRPKNFAVSAFIRVL